MRVPTGLPTIYANSVSALRRSSRCACAGCAISSFQLSRYYTATDELFGFGSDDTWLLFHSYAFDFSVWELWGALLHGARLVVAPLWTARSPQALADLLVDEEVTVLNATPSLFLSVQEAL